MLIAEQTAPVFEHGSDVAARSFDVPLRVERRRQVVAHVDGVRMSVTQHPSHDLQHGLLMAARAFEIPLRVERLGQVVSCSERVGVLYSEQSTACLERDRRKASTASSWWPRARAKSPRS